ncbi:response regulator [Bradyrhizobium sp.]|uniref:adenylate/guanylate cyclase domain-containing protein n=1 Tax=Bradyrhizobium sp. TaxID=376 RepID=UPI0025C43D6E|nr:response regulator [Bradyrhizobium sp.]
MTATILVVDDEPDLEDVVLQHFQKQISDGRIAFVFARDGVDALQAVAANPQIEVVLSDINMPRMDGLTLLRKLQEEEHKRTTIVVSAYDDMANIRSAMNRGAFDFLTKPIDFNDLEATLERTILHVNMERNSQQRLIKAELAQASLSRYFSPQLASRLATGADMDGMTAHVRDISVIFTDITDFLSLVEKTSPAILGEMLNEYMFGMTEIVFAHQGTVAKIVGDAIQILFNAPSDQADYGIRAITCANDLDAWAQGFRLRWRSRDVNFGVTRIGVHAGPALVGNFGGDRFFDYTAHGDTMNTVARLEAVNKHLGTRICASAAVVAIAGRFQGRPIGELVLRGRGEPLEAYELLPALVFNEAAAARYLDAYTKLKSEDASATSAFAALLASNADDSLVEFHLRRLLNGAKGIRIELDTKVH